MCAMISEVESNIRQLAAQEIKGDIFEEEGVDDSSDEGDEVHEVQDQSVASSFDEGNDADISSN
jgi:hypothetical protein